LTFLRHLQTGRRTNYRKALFKQRKIAVFKNTRFLSNKRLLILNKISLVGMQLAEKYITRISTFPVKTFRLVLRSKPRNSPYIFRELHSYQRKLAHSIDTTYTDSSDILYTLDSASLLVKLKPRIFQRAMLEFPTR
jgi:hypothetical protein